MLLQDDSFVVIMQASAEAEKISNKADQQAKLKTGQAGQSPVVVEKKVVTVRIIFSIFSQCRLGPHEGTQRSKELTISPSSNKSWPREIICECHDESLDGSMWIGRRLAGCCQIRWVESNSVFALASHLSEFVAKFILHSNWLHRLN